MSLYDEMILDHSKNPRNFKKLDNSTHESHGHNALCGDNYFLSAIAFQGEGCAISKSSFSIMTTLVKGKTIEEAKELSEKAVRFIMGEAVEVPKELMCFAEVHKYPARVKCATLAWRTLEKALSKDAGEKG